MSFPNRKPDFYRKPKRLNRAFTGPTGMGDIMSGLLKRHGIERQVTSAMIVEKADEFLRENLDLIARPDIRALSYSNQTLLIACRHPGAMYVVDPHREHLKRHLETCFPKLSISEIICRINTEPWQENF